ncbi:Chemotaxis protein CheD [hydrothermal vent metagenome]|uniref:Chemotaxis protein CheD n=1 Tax=hydrothermal vent metagenome TaxID=652676 RepID=A0A3B1BCU6_9ZZZZ
MHSRVEVAIPDMKRCIEGFGHIKRYWDKVQNVYTAKILPGEYYVTIHDESIITVLGSCVSACIRDRVFGVGGMNHFMLPEDSSAGGNQLSMGGKAARYGGFAMEQMINDILKNGGLRKNLEVKIFGGGKVIKNMSTMDIGKRNINFVNEYIKTEGLALLSEDVGDIYPRKVMYFPATGKVKLKKLRNMHNNTIVEREMHYRSKIIEKPVTGDVELF